MSRAPVKHEIHSQRVPTVSALAERVDTSTVSARSSRVVMIGGGVSLPFEFFHAAASGEQFAPSQPAKS